MNKRLYLYLSFCLLAACSQHTTPPPQPDLSPAVPSQWKNGTLSANDILKEDHWWLAFQDPELDRLIRQVLGKNNDLAVAALKVRQARLNAGLTATNLIPDVTATLGAEKQKTWQDTAADNANTTTYSTALSLNYELDLWGKLADERAAANFEAEATAQDRQASALSLIGTTATLYWKQGYLNEQIRINQQSLEYTRQALKIANAQYQSGSNSKLDVLQAEQSVASQLASLEDLLRQREENQNALAILLDQPPGKGSSLPNSLPTTPIPEIPAGLPADVLAHRPDVKAAELRLRSEYATRQYIAKSYYPTFSLTGALGTSSGQLQSVLHNPAGSLGAGLTLPFVEWQTTRLNIAKQQVVYEQTIRNFRQTFYTALSEVENQLSARQHYLNAASQLTHALALARQTEQITAVRYHAGEIAMQDWLEQQENRRSAEKELLQNRYLQLTTQMALYQALGGNPALQQD